jgi:hypothetical protein
MRQAHAMANDPIKMSLVTNGGTLMRFNSESIAKLTTNPINHCMHIMSIESLEKTIDHDL